MSNFITREFYPDEVIFNECSRGEVAYILTSGSVEISTKAGSKRVVLAVLEPVAVFGEMALLTTERKRTATAKALVRSEVVEISKATLEDYIKKSPKFITAVLNTLVDRLKKTTEQASKKPNLLLAICEILNLFMMHGQFELQYGPTVEMMSKTLGEEVPKIIEQLNVLESNNLISMVATSDGHKLSIRLLRQERFLPEAKKCIRK